MPSFDIVVQSEISKSSRAQQLSAIFDCPMGDVSSVHLTGDMPIENKSWNIGLIVGPSGCGKSTILNESFGLPKQYDWKSKSVIDDFDSTLNVGDISAVCQAVGFNTIPAWLRPYAVLSNGEKFRVDLARRLIEEKSTIVVDEFTSVVDRQVAKIGAHAVQKYVRKNNRQFIAASCHYDIIDWLQPDWVLEPASMTFSWRSLQRRPSIECRIDKVSYADSWRIFAPYHYLTNTLHRAAQCFVLFVNDQPAAFAGMLHRPHKYNRYIKGCSRLVTLPDFQGLGLAFVLIDTISAAYKCLGFETRTYPAHPALIRSFDHSKLWQLKEKPGAMLTSRSKTAIQGLATSRPCAVFKYAGPPLDDASKARELVLTV